MRYRSMGRLEYKPSALGFGAMRLPILDNDPAKIDEPEAIRMIRWAIDHGVNYLDTAYVYHGGKSEGLVGRALREGYRQKVKIATKSPLWLLEKPEDAERILGEQLSRLETGSVDFYLLHGIDSRLWSKVKAFKLLEWAERAKADGRIKHLGFSFHDNFETFKEVADGYDAWEFCQLQYNFMDTDAQAGTEGLRYAAGKGLGVIIMEPVRGGALAALPPEIAKIYSDCPVRRSPAEWALQWVWNHPEVSLLLSGMSTMEQVEENVVAAGRSGPGTLKDSDLAVIEKVRREIMALGWIPCTACGYCRPCPNKLDIPSLFSLYNDTLTSAALLERRRRWYGKMAKDERADACAECGECAEKCPQHLPIPELLAKTHKALAPAEPGAGA